MAKTHNNKRDFIQILSSMSHNDINEYIKRYGKKPKKVIMCYYVSKEDENNN